MTRVDSHLHVWRAAEGPTPGIDTIVPPQVDVTIEQAAATLDDCQIDRAVLVQPAFRGEDNHYVAACTRAEPTRFAAVCVVDPRVAGASQRLEHWVGQGCRGLRLRPRIAAESASFGSPETFELWSAAERLRVVVSLLSNPEHQTAIDSLAERFPAATIVIDHLGHSDLAAGITSAPFKQLLTLAGRERVHIKISGFYYLASDRQAQAGLHDAVRAIYEHFGGQRMLWGSDFPHVLNRGGYCTALAQCEELIEDFPAQDRAAILGGNTLGLYWHAILSSSPEFR